MKLWKFSGLFLVITGIIHTVVGLIMAKDIYLAMLRDRLYNSVGEDYSRNTAFWFLLFGFLLILLGQTMQYYIKKEQKPSPLFLGYWLLAIGVVGCFIMPASGFWLVLPQSMIIILAKRKEIAV